MGVSLGSGDKKSVDVEIQVVPFIDLMSCLTAFLLVTAVWTQFAQINIKPKGLGREAKELIDQNRIYASILVTKNELWVGLTSGDIRRINKDGDQQDWQGLREVLDDYKKTSMADRADIEVGAEDDVLYQDIISTMDTAIGAQFRDVGFVDPQSLSVRFKE